MRNMSIFGILLFSLLFTTVSGCQASTALHSLIVPTPEPSQKSPDIRGIVQEVFAPNDKVRGFYVVGKKEIDTTYDRADVGITENTHIFIQQGNRYLITSKYNLQVGQTVEVLFTGPVATSYPVQAQALEIVVINYTDSNMAYLHSLTPCTTRKGFFPGPITISGAPPDLDPTIPDDSKPTYLIGLADGSYEYVYFTTYEQVVNYLKTLKGDYCVGDSYPPLCMMGHYPGEPPGRPTCVVPTQNR